MQTIIVLCGGESSEHEVSLQSANSILNHIPKDKYQVIPVAINKTGQWVTGSPLIQNEQDPTNICLAPNLQPAVFEEGKLNGVKIDAIFPIIHGTYGEDGCLQGLLQMSHVAYVGPGVLGSAVGMDKDIMKRLLIPAGINCAQHFVIYRWQENRPTYEEVAQELGEILFVKPCNLGSSVGISKCHNQQEYDQALQFAFQYDNKLLVEGFIQGQEIEVAVLGNENPKASIPGEVIPGADFYSYDSKYIDSNATKTQIPAQLSSETTQKVQDIAIQSFRLLELAGLTRVDFFVEKNGKIWLNEVNTLPGFTSISMYPKLWEASGIPYPELIHQLIQLAIQRHQTEKELKRNRI
ncbi:MAG: D-alanine--D-alanine ligase A [SAR324 cluster bacterium]|uniref:D-alanine--D-alanine ligase n=1 Tax=SAR324 cluster bacterium TaxID=2024889 RepID=A0A2A4TBD1_9DELT|nr:MAG: D-alanine--D-alanine ligase A [SAR324 cluster bacterium]